MRREGIPHPIMTVVKEVTPEDRVRNEMRTKYARVFEILGESVNRAVEELEQLEEQERHGLGLDDAGKSKKAHFEAQYHKAHSAFTWLESGTANGFEEAAAYLAWSCSEVQRFGVSAMPKDAADRLALAAKLLEKDTGN